MDSSREAFWKIIVPLLFGFFVALIPMSIKFDQLERQTKAERDAIAGQMSHLRDLANQAAEHAADEKRECDAAILGDGAHTILVDVNHPYGGPDQIMYKTVSNAIITLPTGNPRIEGGPIWVVPRAITPHVVDGVLGAAYTHIWPDGRTDGWHAPARAE
jgi:hypothetical protein